MRSQTPSDLKKTSSPRKTFGLRLSGQLIIGLVALISLILCVSSSVIWFKGKPLLEGLGQRSQIQLGQNITLAMEQELSQIAGIAKSLAVAGVSLPKDESIFHASLPAILNQVGENSIIAGGGVWPEPNVFKQGVNRRSFFWARNSEGQLKYYNNYNDPDGMGYHSEEWYVPARLLKPGEVYWSKSYTDPYSLQAMVTCTAPMFEKGVFVGVATIDLKLDRVSQILDQLADGVDAYAFVVDRNNKFIAYPYPDRVITKRMVGDRVTSDFIYANDLADIQPSFSVYAEKLENIERQLMHKLTEDVADYSFNVNMIEQSSYQINHREASRITAHLLTFNPSEMRYPEEVGRLDVKRDSILAERASVIVYQMPATNWKVITVFRTSAYSALADTISKELIFYIAIATLFFGVLAYFGLRLNVLTPIHSMVDQLTAAAESQNQSALSLNYKRNDELGLLAYWFNLRSKQLEAARDEAQRASQAKTEFLAKMSHELRTPLNSIIGFSHRLLKKIDRGGNEFLLEALSRINSNGNYLLELVDDILDIASIEVGAARLHISRCTLEDIFKEVGSEVRLFTDEKRIDFYIHPYPKSLVLHCDKNKIIQVLTNFISNSVKLTSHGSVSLRVIEDERSPDCVKFEISDNGIGISEYDQKKLFEKIRPFDDPLGAARGTGLGLYLTHKFIKMHGGEVSVSSELGKGSVFTFFILKDCKPLDD
ncbi:sensor histidine kinase [Teredinibacter haidensis]|uniref:sensor histidine kinase n=1 Tax=Teredinibacter haidensis TaxID=2731755 RepID=UPI000948FDA2|nr:ATP-binding protein [Teredinibacter haidensis]